MIRYSTDLATSPAPTATDAAGLERNYGLTVPESSRFTLAVGLRDSGTGTAVPTDLVKLELTIQSALVTLRSPRHDETLSLPQPTVELPGHFSSTMPSETLVLDLDLDTRASVTQDGSRFSFQPVVRSVTVDGVALEN